MSSSRVPPSRHILRKLINFALYSNKRVQLLRSLLRSVRCGLKPYKTVIASIPTTESEGGSDTVPLNDMRTVIYGVKSKLSAALGGGGSISVAHNTGESLIH